MGQWQLIDRISEGCALSAQRIQLLSGNSKFVYIQYNGSSASRRYRGKYRDFWSICTLDATGCPRGNSQRRHRVQIRQIQEQTNTNSTHNLESI